jgi:hypothetical protein
MGHKFGNPYFHARIASDHSSQNRFVNVVVAGRRDVMKFLEMRSGMGNGS